MKTKFYFDEGGSPRAEIEKPCHVAGWFLEQDVGSSLYGIGELRSQIHRIEAGNIDSYVGTGNAHTITITLAGVEIINEYSDPLDFSDRSKLTLKEFKLLLEKWAEFLSQEK